MTNEVLMRLGVFFSMLCVMMVLEIVIPRRKRLLGRLKRWPGNLGIIVVGQIVGKLFLPIAPVALAAVMQEKEFGFFSLTPLPAWLEVVLAVLLLDMAIYWQHVAFHRMRHLWLLHRMHHTDLDFDVTTALRFHPVEIALSLFIKLGVIILLCPSPLAVLIFEILLNACAMFNHSNIKIPLGVDKYLRLLMVTPDMHRVHHSTDLKEANMNYGFNFPWWDRMFGTYIAQPKAGHEKMPIGLNIFRNPKYQGLHWLLAIPFIKGRP